MFSMDNIALQLCWIDHYQIKVIVQLWEMSINIFTAKCRNINASD